MAIQIVSREYCVYVDAYVSKYIVDSTDDFADLPPSAPGSLAVAPNGDIMMVNASGEWVAFGG